MKTQVYTLIFLFFSFLLVTNCASESSSSSSGPGAGPEPAAIVVTIPLQVKNSEGDDADNPTQSGVTVEWTSYASSAVDYYKLFLQDKTNPDDIKTIREVELKLNQLTGGNKYLFYNYSGVPTNERLIKGTSYRVRVVAYNKDGEVLSYEDIADDVSFVDFKLVDPPTDNTLSKPELSIADADVKRVKALLTWTASTGAGGIPVTYTITVSPPVSGNSLSGITGTNATIIGLSPNTEYTFSVKAKNTLALESAASDLIKKTTKPPLLTGTLSYNSVDTSKANLTWSPSQIIGSVDPNKLRVIKVDGSIESNWEFVSNKSINSCTITGLAASSYAVLNGTAVIPSSIKNYTFKIEIADQEEAPAKSSIVSFDTAFNNKASTDIPPAPSLSPSAPKINMGVVTANSISFTFEGSKNNLNQPADSYKVYVYPAVAGFPKAANVGDTVTLSGLSTKTKYDIIVEASLNVVGTTLTNYNSTYETTL